MQHWNAQGSEVRRDQGESWDGSYSGRESWDCKSQPFKDRVFQPDDVLSLFRNKGKLAQWTENDKRITTTWSDLKMTLKNLFVPKLTLWMNDCGGWIPQWLKRTTPLISILYQVTHATNIPMCPTNFTFFSPKTETLKVKVWTLIADYGTS